MKSRLCILFCCFLSVTYVAGQQVKCAFDAALQQVRPESWKKENAWRDSMYASFLNDPGKMAEAANATYIIPVVFHVFANNAQALVPVAQCQSGLDKVNEDFNAWNADLPTIDPEFISRVSSLKINFALAQLDTNGNPTTGVTYHPVDSGFGNANANMNALIAQYAWDNYKYMNIFIMIDLFGDGVHNNSGIAYPPNTWDSDHKVDRIVYNYLYLGNTGSSIADGEFQSVLTHEYGHWLNLGHTFGNNCTDADGIADTPPSDVAAGGCGPNAAHCGGNINGENYMDYNASCYKMFTQGQVGVMLAALQHPTRFPLWQQSNLQATGLGQYVGLQKAGPPEKITYSFDGTLVKSNATGIVVYDIMGNCAATGSGSVSLKHLSQGMYIVALTREGRAEHHRIVLTY